jgi:uncharacterized protein (DUF362 family)
VTKFLQDIGYPQLNTSEVVLCLRHTSEVWRAKFIDTRCIIAVTLMSNIVYLTKTTDRLEGTRKVLEHLTSELKTKLSQAKRPLIHPNLVHNERELASVKADVAKVAIEWIRKYNEQVITIADGSYHGTQSAFGNFGYIELAKRDPTTRLVDVNLDESTEVPFYEPSGAKDLAKYSKTVAKADFRLTLAKAKTHAYYIMSASMKTTAYGSVIGQALDYWRMPGQKTIYSRSRWFHKDYQTGHRSLARLYGIYPAQTVVIDGTVAMQGNGPTQGEPIELGWVLGSTNAIAADAVCAYLMGFEPNQIGYLVYAHEAGLGPINMEEVNVIGPNKWQTLGKKVVPPPNLELLQLTTVSSY